MNLLSRDFQALIIGGAVLATLAALLLWNRIRGPRAVRLFGRIGLLLSGYGLTAMAVLVSINIAYGGLIPTWGDLMDNIRSIGSAGGQPQQRGGPPLGGGFRHGGPRQRRPGQGRPRGGPWQGGPQSP